MQLGNVDEKSILANVQFGRVTSSIVVFCASEAGSFCLNTLTKMSDVEDDVDDC